MQGRLVARGEDPGALEGDVDIGPGECCGVTFSGYPDRAATHINSVAGDRNLALETPMNAVIAHQMSIGLDRAKVVQRDHFDVVPTSFDQGAQNPAKSVDGDFSGHAASSLIRSLKSGRAPEIQTGAPERRARLLT